MLKSMPQVMENVQVLVLRVIVCFVFVMVGQSRARLPDVGVGIRKTVELEVVEEEDMVVVTVCVIADVESEVIDAVLFAVGTPMVGLPFAVGLDAGGIAELDAEVDAIMVCGSADLLVVAASLIVVSAMPQSSK